MKESAARSGNRQGTSGGDFKDCFRPEDYFTASKYFAPESLKEAVEILEGYGGDLKVLAGGTDLLVEYYERLYEVKGWLDLKNIPGLKEIKVFEDRIEIGPLVTHTELEKSENIKEYYPVLNRAAADVGSPQIRNRGTIGGNIITASPAGDLLAPLMAYDAEFKLVSTRGERIVPAGQFFTGPKRTIISSDEILSRIIIPLPGERTYGNWCKVGKRKALIISSITLALVVKFNKERVIKDIRACLGAVAPTPVEIKEVRKRARGKRIEDLNFSELGELVAERISPIDDIRGTAEYRRDVAREIMINALEEIAEKAAE